MRFWQRAEGSPERLAVFPGTYNPVTTAHMALAEAALAEADEVAFVLPRAFPHKEYAGATYEQRVDVLLRAIQGKPRFSLASTGGGLFLEIAAECRREYGAAARLSFLCGRDAAERITGWDYGRAGALEEMFRDFDLLVAARGGDFNPGRRVAGFARRLEVPAGFGDVSATEVRRRISYGEPWEHLVPAQTREATRRYYR